jgi:D-lactate dehydrogenase
MKIAHFSVVGWEEDYLKSSFKDNEGLFFEKGDVLSVINKIKDIEALDVFIYSKVDKKVIDNLPNLKIILTRSTGFDHVDIEYAKSKGIVVCNVPDYGTATVAEHTFALLLGLSKQIVPIVNRTKTNNFNFQDKLGFDLENKTLGVIGAGKIGKHVITIARGFGMKVLAHDVYQDLEFASNLGYQYVELDELLKNSHILSLHTPANDYTCSLLSKNNINLIKKGAIFINTSRGCLIRNEDLVYALDQEIISACGLDTMDGENDMFLGQVNEYQQKLLDNQNVIYTPHSAFYTKEALIRILDTTVLNFENFIKNNPANLVN